MSNNTEINTALPIISFFRKISAIPRGSGNESGIADYLCRFAEAHSLEYYRDQHNNVLIKKPAFKGYESRPAVMLQAHVDMVCEKLPEKQHDFLADPIIPVIDGDIITASGTTLGADNGIGVAAMLSALDDPTLPAPALECLFTTEEETGMSGALGFDYTKLTARKLINLDESGEGHACCGCAGGVNATLTLDCEYVPGYGKTVLISLEGLAGGHSGMDVDLGRQNAIKLLGSALLSLYDHSPFCLVTLVGGSKPNVIPSSAYAVAAFFDTKAAKDADTYLRSYLAQAKASFCRADKKLKYSFKNLSKEAKNAVIPANPSFPNAQLSYKSTHKLLALIAASPNGVVKYIPSDRTQVLSSVNQVVSVGITSLSQIGRSPIGHTSTFSIFTSDCSPHEVRLTVNVTHLSKITAI